MNRHPDIDPDQDPKNDPANDAAWDLLLKARKVEVSPFFARNVLREVRLEDMADSEQGGAASGWRSILSFSRLLTGAAAVAIILAVIVVSDRDVPNSTGTSSIAQVPEPTEAIEINQPAATPLPAANTFDMSDYEDEIDMIDYLDGLLAVQDISMLDDEALSELLF